MTCAGGLTEPDPTPRFVHSEQSNQTIQADKTSAGIGTTVEHPPRERIVTKEIVTRGLTQRPTPTQSWSKQAKPKQPNQPSNAMRGGMWNGRASRRTHVSNTKQASKASAGIGTTVEHPRRTLIEYP